MCNENSKPIQVYESNFYALQNAAGGFWILFIPYALVTKISQSGYLFSHLKLIASAPFVNWLFKFTDQHDWNFQKKLSIGFPR